MSERKVLNKYYPPDFDPAKIPRLRLPKERQYTVRLMAPCNMRCITCGEYIYKGKKFNARKETVQNEEYLGIKIFRFYIKCPRCLAEITFKTDPENADYIVEHGATRNFQALKLAEEAAEKEARDKEEEEKNNPMKLLENRTKASKHEMESLEALEEIRELNQRHAKVDFEQLLSQNHQKLLDEQRRQEEEDEAFIQNIFYTVDGEKVKRIVDNPEPQTLLSKSINKHETPTNILVDNSSDKVALKRKFHDHSEATSRQRSIDTLKKAVKLKRTTQNASSSASGSDINVNQKSQISNATSSVIKELAAFVNETSVANNDRQKLSGLSLLTAYSGSDSDD